MIIICPECAARYIVSDTSIGDKGRTVRCANCQHQWHQTPVKQKEIHTYEDSAPALDFESIPDAVKPIHDDIPALAEPKEPRKRIEPKEKQEKEIKPPAVWMPQATGFGAAASIFLLFLIILGAFKSQVLAAWPAASLLYETVGVKVPSPGEGLIFDRVVADAAVNEEGQRIVKLSGVVVNLTSETRKVPQILASLSTEKGEKKGSWLIQSTVKELKAEESFPFDVEYPVTSPDITSVNVTFLAGKYKQENKEQKKEVEPVSEKPDDSHAGAPADEEKQDDAPTDEHH